MYVESEIWKTFYGFLEGVKNVPVAETCWNLEYIYVIAWWMWMSGGFNVKSSKNTYTRISITKVG